MIISYGTDVGLLRSDNQDTVFAKAFSDLSGLFIVADGMGGYEGGKLASTMATEIISGYIMEADIASMSTSEIKKLLKNSVAKANMEIYNKSLSNSGLEGMGTTVVAGVVNDGRLYIASVGDSRGYIYSSGVLKQLTTDHSLVESLISRGLISREEARTHPQRNVITRAVGSEDNVVVDVFVSTLKPGDVIMLCSDGLYTMVSDDDISDILNSNKSETADALIKAANKYGGKDNISVITVKICDEEKKS